MQNITFLKNLNLHKLFLALTILFSAQLRAADRSDIYIGASALYNLEHESSMSHLHVGYVFADDFGVGLSLDAIENFTAPAVEFRWMIEPFEFAMALGSLFWEKPLPKESYFHTSLTANYLIAIAPGVASAAVVKAHLFDKRFRGSSFGLGARFLF